MRKDVCKHFNGSHHNDACECGVAYKDVVPDWDNIHGRALRFPCHTKAFPDSSPSQLEEFNKRGKCDKLELPTAEELEQSEKKMKKAIEEFKTVLPIVAKVKKEHKGQSWKGVEVCPVCKGKLHLTHASINGHVWGKCETEGCLAWME